MQQSSAGSQGIEYYLHIDLSFFKSYYVQLGVFLII